MSDINQLLQKGIEFNNHSIQYNNNVVDLLNKAIADLTKYTLSLETLTFHINNCNYDKARAESEFQKTKLTNNEVIHNLIIDLYKCQNEFMLNIKKV
jgi:hypothetical protein